MRALIAVALLLTIGAERASAEIYCASTTTQLLSAFAGANASPEDSEIRLVPGVYDLMAPTNAAALEISGTGSLTITGGYASGCPNQITRNPEQTLLRVSNTGRLMNILFLAGSSNNVTLSNLGFRQGASSTSNQAGCITAEGDVGASGKLTISHASFRLCSSTSITSALRVIGRGLDLDLRNSVFADNASTGGAIALSLQADSVFYLYNNTVAFNARIGPAASGPAGMQLGMIGTGALVWMINNIYYGNGTGQDTDILFNGNPAGVANHNIIGRSNPFPSLMAESNNSSANPLLISSVNLKLVADSPARNAGNNSAPNGLPAFDLDGTPRPQGGQHDIGAYEFAELFSSGFED